MGESIHEIDQDDASPLTYLGRLASDEGASVAVEFIVLIPVYLLLLQGLFMIANLALVRTALVQANRFQAWAPKDPETYSGLKGPEGAAFFAPYPGEFSLNPVDSKLGVVRDKAPVSYAAIGSSRSATPTATIQAADLLDTSGARDLERSKWLAADALNNRGKNGSEDQALWFSRAQASFKYTGVLTAGWTSITQRTRCGVLLPRKHTREEFKDSVGDPHPVLNWRVGNGQDVKGLFDPTQVKNMPLSPFYKQGGMFKLAKGGKRRDDGVWDSARVGHDGSRIGGSITKEQEYCTPKPR